VLVFETFPLPYSRLLEDADADEPLEVGSMLSLIFCFNPSPAQSIWFISSPSTANITCFPWLTLWLLLLDELDVGDGCRSGRLLVLSLRIFCGSRSSVLAAKSQSVLVEVDTTLPVFSSMFTCELTFLMADVLLLVEAASESVTSGRIRRRVS
jgi:hypothetical protein